MDSNEIILKKLKNKNLSTEESDSLRTQLARNKINELNETSAIDTVSNILTGVHEPDGGATFKLSGRQPSAGFCASPYPEYSKVFNDSKEVTFEALTQYIADVESKSEGLFDDDETYLGVWNDPETGKVYLDISKRYLTAEEARKECEDHDQIAFFDLQTFESVDVDRKALSGQKME